MKKNGAGVIISVKDMSEIGESMVHCGVCGKDFIPTVDCDCFPLRQNRNGFPNEGEGTEEIPLKCERCLDKEMAADGVRLVLEMGRPDGRTMTILPEPTSKKWWQFWKKM